MEQKKSSNSADKKLEAFFTALFSGTISQPTHQEPQKGAKRRRLQKVTAETACSNLPTTSGSLFGSPNSLPEDEPSPFIDQHSEARTKGRHYPKAPIEPAANQEGTMPGQQSSNIPDSGSSDLSPKFLSLIRQAVREEITSSYHQKGHEADRSSLPSSSSSRREEIPLTHRGSTWPTEAAQNEFANRKRGRDRNLGEDDHSSESDTDDTEVGEFSSDEEEEETEVPDHQLIRFFKMEDYQYLLSKSLTALDLRGNPEAEEQTPTVPGQRHRAKGNQVYLPISKTREKVFPLPQYFERLLKAEWSKPMAERKFPGFLKKLYALPSFTNDFLQVPLVDAPVIALHSSSLISVDGQGSIRDRLDRKADSALRNAHKATTMSIRASAIASIVSRAAIVWTRKLLQLIPDDRRLNEGVNRLLKAVSFTTDAALDSMVFSSRAMASAASARRALWLRPWQVDDNSKAIVSDYPFQGGRLFGDALNKILVETRGGKKALPRTSRHDDKRSFGNSYFRAQHVLPRFKQGTRKSNWNQTRQPFRRGYFNTGSSRQPNNYGN